MTLHAHVSQMVKVDPKITTGEIYEVVRSLHPKDNPRWIKHTINQYRNYTLKRLRERVVFEG